MKLIAHRGYNAKDNTKEAFQNAKLAGFDMIEVDLHRTLDYKIVCIHDRFCGPYDVEKTELSVLQKYDPDLLSLDDLFTNFSPLVYSIYLDLKGSNSLSILLMNYLKEKRICLRNLIVASFNRNHLYTFIHNKYPVKLGFLTCNVFLRCEYDVLFQYVDYIIVDVSVLHPFSHNMLSLANKKLFVFTCKSKAMYDYICSFSNVSGIISDIVIPVEKNINQ